jgi:gliding motility-associated-like protein
MVSFGFYTPNKDGKNELFKALGSSPGVAEYHLAIYNRWGERIFETRDIAKGWTGEFKGKLQEAGNYIWYCRFKKSNSSAIILKKGTLTLIK